MHLIASECLYSAFDSIEVHLIRSPPRSYFDRIRPPDSVGLFRRIRSRKFGRISSDLVGFRRIRSESVGICQIWSDSVGFGRSRPWEGTFDCLTEHFENNIKMEGNTAYLHDEYDKKQEYLLVNSPAHHIHSLR